MTLSPDRYYTRKELLYRIEMIFLHDPTIDMENTPQAYNELMFSHIGDAIDPMAVIEVFVEKVTLWGIYEFDAVKIEDYEFAGEIKRVREEIVRVYTYLIKELFPDENTDHLPIILKLNEMIMKNFNEDDED